MHIKEVLVGVEEDVRLHGGFKGILALNSNDPDVFKGSVPN